MHRVTWLPICILLKDSRSVWWRCQTGHETVTQIYPLKHKKEWLVFHQCHHGGKIVKYIIQKSSISVLFMLSMLIRRSSWLQLSNLSLHLQHASIMVLDSGMFFLSATKLMFLHIKLKVSVKLNFFFQFFKHAYLMWPVPMKKNKERRVDDCTLKRSYFQEQAFSKPPVQVGRY